MSLLWLAAQNLQNMPKQSFLVRQRVKFTDLPNQIASARQLLKPNSYEEALSTAGSKSSPRNE